MDIPLPHDLEELVRRKVEAGEYDSASDVVVEALYLLAARDRFVAGEEAELRREIELGIGSASVARWSRRMRFSRASASGCARSKHRRNEPGEVFTPRAA